MPHQCTNCGRSFADGSKEMLSGCPDCGGNKFRFLPSGAADISDADRGSDRDQEPPERETPSSVTRAAAHASAAVRDWVRTDRATDLPEEKTDLADDETTSGWSASEPTPSTTPDGENATEPRDHDDEPIESATNEDQTAENGAQAAARSGVVSDDELPPEPISGSNGTVAGTPDTENGPDLDELREELNDQFESIRIVNPGQYELNLMELYKREEYIISLQEDGRYVIDVPESMRTEPD